LLGLNEEKHVGARVGHSTQFEPNNGRRTEKIASLVQEIAVRQLHVAGVAEAGIWIRPGGFGIDHRVIEARAIAGGGFLVRVWHGRTIVADIPYSVAVRVGLIQRAKPPLISAAAFRVVETNFPGEGPSDTGA
jgi:hypothetical protein